MGDLDYCRVSYVFDVVRTGIARANSGNYSCHRDEATSRIGVLRFLLCLRMGSVISVGDMIHGSAAYQLVSDFAEVTDRAWGTPIWNPRRTSTRQIRYGPAQSVSVERYYRDYTKTRRSPSLKENVAAPHRRELVHFVAELACE